MKNSINYWFVSLCIVFGLSACCKGKKDDKYNQISNSDREWYMEGRKQFAIYRDSATNKRDTVRYGDVSTSPIDCEKTNAGTWLVACNITTCNQYVVQESVSVPKDSFYRVTEIVYTGSFVVYKSKNQGKNVNYQPVLSNGMVNGKAKIGYYLNFPNSFIPEPYTIFLNKEEGILYYEYKDANGKKYKWEKIN